MSEPVQYLALSDFAARVGITSNTAASYGRKGLLPEPDALTGLGQRATRGWLPETVDAWQANRAGQGARTDLKPQSHERRSR